MLNVVRLNFLLLFPSLACRLHQLRLFSLISYLIYSCLMVTFILAVSPVWAISMKVDRVLINASTGVSGGWVPVTFSTPFPSVPAVFALPTNTNTDPATVRIRNVTATGFEILVVEPEGSDGSTAAMTVDYFAAETGSYTIDGPVRIDVGLISTSTQQGSFVASTGWDTVTFSNTYTSPAVITQVQTVNSQPSLNAGLVGVPWLEVAVQNVTSTGMEVALERSETSGGTVVAETIGYLVMSSGDTATVNGQTFRAIATPNSLAAWDAGCTTIDFSPIFTSVPLVIASQNSRDGNNGSWVRRCSISSSSVGLLVDEDVASDTERTHVTEQAGIIAVTGAFNGKGNSKRMAAGKVSIDAGVSTSDWTTVSFPNAFDETPLIFSLMTNDESDPAALRIRNVSVNGFDIAAFKPENEVNAAIETSVDYVAVVPGEHLLSSGDVFEVGSRLTNRVQGAVGSTGWDTQTFNSTFSSAPALLTKIQTVANEPSLNPSSPSVPWLVETVRNLSATSFQLALETALTTSGSVSLFESYGYFAVRNGANAQLEATDGSRVDYEMKLSADNIFGWGDGCYNTNFIDTYTTPYVFASQVKRDGSDGGWMRRCNLQNTSVGLQVDEDVNGSRNHTSEMAGIFVFSKAFEADFYKVDHYAVSHSVNAVTCEAEAIAIFAHNNVDTVSPADGTHIRITATSSSPSWDVADVQWSLKVGAGVFTTPSAGVAEYVFDGSESSVELWLSNTSVADIDIDVVDVIDSGITDKDDGAAEDLLLSFSDSGLKFYADNNNDGNADGVSPIQSPLVAGQRSNQMILRAVETSAETGACLARVNGSVNVNMAYECVNSDSCVRDKDLDISGTPIEENNFLNVVDYSSVSLTFDGEGEAPFTLRYFDAGSIRLHANLTLPATATEPAVSLIGSSATTVVAPANLKITEVKTTVVAPDIAMANPATTTTGSGFVAAAEPFTVVVQAQGATGILTPNFGRESPAEGIKLNIHSLLMPASGVSSALSSPSSFVATSLAGEFENSSVSWNQVGTIALYADMADGSYLDTINVVGDVSGAVGRFYPKEFVLQSAVVNNGCAAGGFTYMSDQSFNYRPVSVGYSVHALTSSGTIASNYDVGLGYPVTGLSTVLENNDSGTDLSARMFVPSASWNGGVWVVSSSRNSAFRRNVSSGNEVLDGPYGSAQLGLMVDGGVDPTSFTETAFTQNVTTTGDCVAVGDCDSVVLGGALNFVFGRAITQSVFGPEVTPLALPFETQMWNGIEFVRNTADDCTAVAAADIGFNSSSLSVDANRTITVGGGVSTGAFTMLNPGVDMMMVNGDAGLVFSAPGATNTGTINVSIDLTNYAWLRFDWNQDSNHANDYLIPLSTATFGSYRGHDRIIFWLEPFN